MSTTDHALRHAVAVTRWSRALSIAVLGVAVLDWIGWTTGIELLTRFYPNGPTMTPWTALWLAALATSLLLQSDHPPRGRLWVGRGLAALVGALAVLVLLGYLTGRS